MNLPWLYRAATIVAVCVLSLAVIVLCAQSNSNLDGLAGVALPNRDDYQYATLGEAVGSITVVTGLLLLILDIFLQDLFTSFLVTELAWSTILFILWIAVGATTLTNGKTLFKGRPCSDFDVILEKAKDVCEDIHPIATLSFITYAFLFLYSGVLIFLGLSSGSGGWTTSLKNRQK
ncbi:hypothetical protein C8Q77DRAFT_860736 [Trametes polyzona]|nr:hypothetical protein C8Q77DRAFT_860736 [Trametes polyzona]